MTVEWADHESLLGMLQRGRGRGLQEVLEHPDGDRLVVRCIEDNLGWDFFEERGWYFARLMTAFDIPVDAVACDLSADDFDCSVWCETLLALSREGSEAAAGVLHSCIRKWAPDGRVGGMVDLIWDEGGATGRDGLREVALDRMGVEPLKEWAHPREDSPWLAWRDVPAIGAALEAWSPPRRPEVPDLSALDAARLARAAREWPAGLERRAALAELGRRGEPVLLKLAEDPGLRNEYGAVPGLARALAALGPGVLPHARGWAGASDGHLRWLAAQLLAELGEESDGPLLVGLFDAAVDTGDWMATELLAAGLGRIGGPVGAPLLMRAWVETLHSHARAGYLRALLALDAAGPDALLDEAVDDCECEVRELAGTTRGQVEDRPPTWP